MSLTKNKEVDKQKLRDWIEEERERLYGYAKTAFNKLLEADFEGQRDSLFKLRKKLDAGDFDADNI